MEAPVTKTLDYAPASTSRRKWLVLTAVVVLLALTISIYQWGGLARQRVEFLMLQRRCMNYSPPADLVIYENDKTRVPALMASQKGYRQSSRGREAWFTPAFWKQYPGGGWEPGPAFLHRRKTPGGETRLVAVDVSSIGARILLYPQVFIPGSIRRDPRKIQSRQGYLAVRLGWADDGLDSIRVFPGQPDPADTSHFTLLVETNGVRETIDGWLRDDDTVLLWPRTGWIVEWYGRSLPQTPLWMPSGSKGRGQLFHTPLPAPPPQ